MEEVKGLQGTAFGKQYRDDQIEAHDDAVDFFGRYASSGDNPELKAWQPKRCRHCGI